MVNYMPTMLELAEQLRVWARSHEGGEEVIASMERSVPIVHAAFAHERRQMLADGIAAKASRQGEPWSSRETDRLAAGMRAGESVERMALALGRTVPAVKVRCSVVRRTYPPERWELRERDRWPRGGANDRGE